MVLDINIDVEQGYAYVVEETDYGTKKSKKVELSEFIQNYVSLIKEKEDNYSSLFFPAGTVEYRKNVNNKRFMVQTYPYKSFYNLENDENDYLIVVRMNEECTRVTSFICYKTEGAFNKFFSNFYKIYEGKESFIVKDEEVAIKECLNRAIGGRTGDLSGKLKYKDII